MKKPRSKPKKVKQGEELPKDWWNYNLNPITMLPECFYSNRYESK